MMWPAVMKVTAQKLIINDTVTCLSRTVPRGLSTKTHMYSLPAVIRSCALIHKHGVCRSVLMWADARMPQRLSEFVQLVEATALKTPLLLPGC